MVSCPINSPPKLGSTRMMSGSGDEGGGALGPKSRGGLVITDKGAPNCALESWAWASAGSEAAAPASIRRRLRSVMIILPVFYFVEHPNPSGCCQSRPIVWMGEKQP